MLFQALLAVAAPLALVAAAPPSPPPKPPGHAAPGGPKEPAAPGEDKGPGSNAGPGHPAPGPGPGPGAGAEPDANGYSLREVGARNTLASSASLVDWRIWLEKEGEPASFWHDVPIYPDESNKQVVNMVVEIPRWSDGKIEISRKEPLNPIFHDDKNDLPRFVESVWPHKSYPFSYGSIVQTWEDPTFNHPFTGEKGDKDPMDVFEIGDGIPYTGQIKQVKLLGALAPNDGGETDWKVLAIDVNDPLAPLVNNYDDIEKYRPGLIAEYRQWFTQYKIARGDGPIPIIGQYYQNATYTAQTVAESHSYWLNLVQGHAKIDAAKYNWNQTSNPAYADAYTNPKDAAAKFDIPAEADIQPAAERPSRFDRWFYLEGGVRLIELPGQKD